MTGVARALVVTAGAALALLVAGVWASPALSDAGLWGLLLVPVVRNAAFVVVEKRRAPRALAALIGVSLVAIYLWCARGG